MTSDKGRTVSEALNEFYESFTNAQLLKVAQYFTRVRWDSVPQIYDDQQVGTIKKCLAAVGIDCNAVVFNSGHSLLEVLQSMAAFHTGATNWILWPTPKARAAVLKKELKALKTARLALGSVFIPPMFEGDPEFDVDYVRGLENDHEVAHEALEKLIAYKQRYHDGLVVKSSRSRNAKKKHVQFWRELAHLWQKTARHQTTATQASA